MKIKNLISLILLFNLLPGFYMLNNKKESKNGNSKETTTLYYGNRLEIGADLDGNGKTEKVYINVISEASKKELDSITFDQSYEDYLIQFEKIKPRIVLNSNHGIPKLVINNNPEILSPLDLSNLGDLNKDGNDEIGYVLEWYELQKTDSLFILTFKDKKWSCIGSIPISISSSERYYSVDTYNIITKKNDKLFYKDRDGKEMELNLRK